MFFGRVGGAIHTVGAHDTREAAEFYGNYSMQTHSGEVNCVAFVADLNAAVTCGMDGKVHFIDLVKRRVLRTFEGHADRAVFSFIYCKK